MDKKIKLVKKVMKPLRFIWIALCLFLILFIAVYFLLKIPYIQNYIADKTTSYLSKRLDTKVEIKEIDINVFKGIELEELYIEDLQKDTLIYVESLYSDFYNSLRSFYDKSFRIKNIELNNGKIHINRTLDDPFYNYLRLLNREYDPYSIDTLSRNAEPHKLIQNINDKRNKDKLNLNLNSLTLNNIEFKNEDFAFGTYQLFNVDHLRASFDTFNIHESHFSIQDINVSGIYGTHKMFSPEKVINLPETEQKQNPFKVRINEIDISDVNLSIINEKQERQRFDPSTFNSNYVSLKNVKFNAENVLIRDPYYVDGQLNEFSGKLGDLVIKDFTSERFYLEKRKSGFENIKLFSEKSNVSGNIGFKYRKIQDWNQFVDRVIIDAELDKTEIAVKDLFYFSPLLQENKFFKENEEEIILLDGKINGRVNSFNARDFSAELTNNLTFNGSLIARDITDPDESLLNIGIKMLHTDVNTLNKLIPGFEVPQNFYQLKDLHFQGRFDGYFQDFVAYGDLLTDLGRADVDMRLNLKSGSKSAQYSGKLNLYDFDLKSWSGNENFGNVSFSANVENGRGLELNTAYAELGGEIISFEYNSYLYKGLIDAKLEQNLFDGKFSSNDENLDLDFEGSIDFTGEIPRYDFKANIDSINLKNLNLSRDIDHIEGDLDIKAKGASINDIVGSALGNNIVIHRGLDTLDFGHLAIASSVDEEDVRSIYLDSNIGNAEIIGSYQLTELPDAIISLLKSNYPDFTENLKFVSGKPKENVKADFKIDVTESAHLASFLSPKKIELDSFSANGSINYDLNEFTINLESPNITYDTYGAHDLKASFNLDENFGILKLESEDATLANGLIKQLNATGKVTNDSIHFDVNALSALDSINNIDLAGEIFPANKEIEFQFTDFGFDLLGSRWGLTQNNSVTVGNQKLELKNFNLFDQNRKISVRSINNNKGIKAKITDVELGLVNQFLGSDDIVLKGNTNATISFKNIFNKTGLFINSEVDRLYVNDQLMGRLNLDATTDFDRQLLEYTGLLTDDDKDVLILRGNYGTESKLVNAQLDVNEFPLNFLENFLEGSIANTQGLIKAQIDVDGTLDNLDTRGTGEVFDGYSEIVYLGTKYSFEEAIFTLKKNFVDFTDVKLIDSRSQEAILTGGLTHNNFKNLGLDLSIESDNFVLLNTDENDNESYYGFGQGKAKVDFDGTFNDLTISIDAVTGEETNLTLPITYSNSARESSFLPIVSREEFILNLENESKELKNENYYVGLTLKMALSVNPNALMNVVFDPVTGHQLQGRGFGDIQLDLSPNGDINMLGRYNIENGTYDFALENLIKKEFTIQEGGYISWTGDPLDANINIAADYKSIRSSLEVFLAEYLSGNTELLNRASQETDVLLTVNLLDKLLNPTIKFDIQFPNLTGELSTLVNSKLDLLKEDPLSLNNQVLGLLVFNSFLPNNNPIATFNTSAVNSSVGVILGEFVSAQLSTYVSSVMESVLRDNAYLNDIDVDVRFDPTTNILSPSTNNTGYGLTLKPDFSFSDKFQVILGGDFQTPNNIDNEPNTTGDFIVDYYLDKDKKIKVRIYARTDRQPILGRRQRFGSGFYYRKEFSSLKEVLESMNVFAKDIKENKDNGK